MKNAAELKTFNVIAAGYGGQGVLTLAKIIARAAFIGGLDVRQAELHGLSQRGGSLTCHVRFGEKVHSPLVRQGGADLIIALEAAEALRACEFANSERTVVLSNTKLFNPARTETGGSSPEGVLAEIGKYTESVETIDVDKIVRDLTGEITSVNIFMLAWALGKGVLPLENDIVWQAITETLRERFWEEARKVFDTALGEIRGC